MQFDRLVPAALLLCLSTPAPVLAATSSAPAAVQPAGEAQPAGDAQTAKPRKICRSETPTGSVRPRRVCRTVEQVAADSATVQRTREASSQGRSAP